MAWWETQPTQAANQDQAQLFWQLWQQEQKRQADLAEQKRQQQDAGGIMGWAHSALKMPLDLAGDLATKAATGVSNGLEWYDQNVVAPTWNNVVGPAAVGALGRQWSRDTEYENLPGGARFAAGLVSDPLTYVPVAGAAGKALKAVKGFESLGRGIEMGAHAADVVQFNAIKWPLKLGVGYPAKGVGAVARFGGEQLAGKTDLGAELSRLTRETTGVTAVREKTTATAAALNLVRTHALEQGRTSLTTPEIGNLFNDTVEKVGKYYSDLAGARASGDTALLNQLEENMPSRPELFFYGKTTGAYRPRSVNKRVAEGFRRMATGSSRVEKEVDLDRFSDTVSRFVQGQLSQDKALEELLHTVGNDALASKVLADPNGANAQALNRWLREHKQFGAIDMGFTNAAADVDPNTLIQKFGDGVARQVQGDIARSTSLAREFMNGTRIGPIPVELGKWANNFDSVYGKVWKGFIDPKIVQPFTQLILGQPLFAVQNAMEEVGQQMLGGTFSRHNWHLSADEFINLWKGVDPTIFPLAPSLAQGAREHEAARVLFEDRGVQRSLLAGTQGGLDVRSTELVRDPATGQMVERSLSNPFLFPETGWKGWAFGGKTLRQSNLWSSDMRRASYLNKLIADSLDALPDIGKLEGPERDLIRKAGWEQRWKAEAVIGAMMKASGRTDDQVLLHLRDARLGDHQAQKRVWALLDTSDFKTDTAQRGYLNTKALREGGDSRTQVLQQMFDLELKRMTADAEHTFGFLDKWADEAGATFNASEDIDTLTKGLMSWENARQVLDQSWHSQRAEAARIRSVPLPDHAEEKEAWTWSKKALDLAIMRHDHFRTQSGEAFSTLTRKLGPGGMDVLTDRGTSSLADLDQWFKKWGDLTDAQAQEFREANKQVLSRRRTITPEQRAEQAMRHEEIRARYKPRVDEANAKVLGILGDDLTTWFKRGEQQQAAWDFAEQAAPHAARNGVTEDEARVAIARAMQDDSPAEEALRVELNGTENPPVHDPSAPFEPELPPEEPPAPAPKPPRSPRPPQGGAPAEATPTGYDPARTFNPPTKGRNALHAEDISSGAVTNHTFIGQAASRLRQRKVGDTIYFQGPNGHTVSAVITKIEDSGQGTKVHFYPIASAKGSVPSESFASWHGRYSNFERNTPQLQGAKALNDSIARAAENFSLFGQGKLDAVKFGDRLSEAVARVRHHVGAGRLLEGDAALFLDDAASVADTYQALRKRFQGQDFESVIKPTIQRLLGRNRAAYAEHGDRLAELAPNVQEWFNSIAKTHPDLADFQEIEQRAIGKAAAKGLDWHELSAKDRLPFLKSTWSQLKEGRSARFEADQARSYDRLSREQYVERGGGKGNVPRMSVQENAAPALPDGNGEMVSRQATAEDLARYAKARQGKSGYLTEPDLGGERRLQGLSQSPDRLRDAHMSRREHLLGLFSRGNVLDVAGQARSGEGFRDLGALLDSTKAVKVTAADGEKIWTDEVLPVLQGMQHAGEQGMNVTNADFRLAFRDFYNAASRKEKRALKAFLEERGNWPPKRFELISGAAEGDAMEDEAARVMKLMDEADTFARQNNTTTEAAQKHLWERYEVERLLADDVKAPEFLARYGSIFTLPRRTIPNIPAQGYEPAFVAAREKMLKFAAALERLDDIPVMPSKLEEALDAATRKSLAAAGQAPDLEQTLKSTLQGVTDHYHKWFTNYDEGNTLDNIMRHFFPFWRYEKQRWPRLARAVAHNPWMATNAFRYVDDTEDGYFHVPGTSFAMSPLQGSMYNALLGLMKDGGFYYEHRGGAWDRFHQLAVTAGFVPGPTVSGPLAISEGRAGEIYPTNINTALSAAEATRGIPYVGDTIGGGAHALRQLPDRWYDYRVNQELAAMGVHPYDATPEQLQEAQTRAGRSNALSGATGYTFREDQNWRKEQSDLQRQAAAQAGVPADVIQEARRRGKNALAADQEGDPFDAQGEPYLNIAQRRQIEDAHPEWQSLAAVRESLRSPEEQNLGRMRRKTETSYKDARDEVEAQLLPVYLSFAKGEISGQQWRDFRKTALARLRGAADLQSRIFKDKTGQAVTSTKDPARVDWLARQYYDIEAPTDSNGMPNYDALEFMQSRFLAENNVSKDELTYIKDLYPRQKFKNPLMNSLESEYGDASDLNHQYFKLAKYPGLSSTQAEKADKAIALAQKVEQANPKLTVTQALAVVARYDPDGAQLARKALTIQKGQRKGTVQNPRKEFRDSQPLWQRYYGD